MSGGASEGDRDSFVVAVVISADAEWRIFRELKPDLEIQRSPYGEWSLSECPAAGGPIELVYFHGGWGKIRAAGSAQYVIDRHQPDLIVNIGTCGGFHGHVSVGEIILAERTVVYDIHERMFDADAAIQAYATRIDVEWTGVSPPGVRRSLLISGDRDLDPDQIKDLHERYGAIAGDWESGAIAHICALNRIPCLILRGVSDLVSEITGEAYDSPDQFIAGTRAVLTRLLTDLPDWIDRFVSHSGLCAVERT